MEAAAAEVKAAVKPESNMEEVQAVLELITGSAGRIQIPMDDIKERVLVTLISTKCDAPQPKPRR